MGDTFSINNISPAGALLLSDSYNKLGDVPFPVELARASKVMSYREVLNDPTLIFECNAAIHFNRVKPPEPLNIHGTATKMYCAVNIAKREREEVLKAKAMFDSLGYYTFVTSKPTRTLYISWDEKFERSHS